MELNMKGNEQALTVRQTTILALSAAAFMFGTPVLKGYGAPVTGLIVMTLAATFIFIIILQMKIDRLSKGLALIGLAAIISLWPPIVFLKAKLNFEASFALEVICSVFTFAASGAGGSIIAGHGDKYSTDSEPVSVMHTASTDSKRIDKLVDANQKQLVWIKSLCALVGLLLSLIHI